jgi:glycosyltransferase involved in cell wall biosynthesis
MDTLYIKKLLFLMLIYFLYGTQTLLSFVMPSEHRMSSKGIIEKPIIIVICSYNNSEWYRKNLDTIFSQNYENYSVIYIDDFSPDNTGDLVKQYVEEHGLEDKCLLIKNKQRSFKMANLYKGYHMCPDNTIIIEYDGDDWLPDPEVFSAINKTYTNADIWMTYGHFMTWPSQVSTESMPNVIVTTIPEDLIKNNLFRKIDGCIWAGLRTYYAWLVKRVRLQDLLYKNNWLSRTSDTAIMLPMFEMAGHRYAFINRILLMHNHATTLNDYKVDARLQYRLELFIRALPPYDRLSHRPEPEEAPTVAMLLDIAHKNTYDSLFATKQTDDIMQECHYLPMQNTMSTNYQAPITKEYLITLLKSISATYIILLQDPTFYNKMEALKDGIAMLEKTKARGLFFSVDARTCASTTNKTKPLYLTPHVRAWQFGFGNQKILKHALVLNAAYRKDDLLKILESVDISSFKDLANGIVKSLKQLEVGLFFDRQP